MTASRRYAWALGLLAFAGMVSLGSPAGASNPEPLAPAVAPSAPTASAPAAQPAPAASPGFATLEAVGGQVSVIRLGQQVPLSPSMTLERNDIVVTKRGRATVRFHSDGTVVRVGPDSRVQINESATERDVTVFFGRLWAHVVRWKERTTRFATGSTIAAIRGTEVSLGVASDGNKTNLAVLEGHVEAQTDAGTLALAAGQSSVSEKGRKPAPGVRVRPQDAVQWALYYLPVLYTTPGELGQGQEWQAKVREAAEAYQKGDLAAAVDSVDAVAAEGIQDARFFAFRASLRLATGNVEEAEKDIEQALKLTPNDSDALALKAIVAVARNDNDAALATARQAVSANPKSSTAQIALSYALQARFDLQGARQSLEDAVKLDPKDALAWARLAEIRSSFGDLGGAFEAAQKATQLQPNLARTQTVLGFAYLTRVHTREAAEAFHKAIQLDANDPLPRLGLGLAEIRDGHLSEGTKELEVAVSLDPAESVVRSYLGKAYFEEKRTKLDEREYGVAEQSDPKDPTPWFYNAIARQTTNQPVEALKSLEKAIELNDNRAVYRSRLLLDSDLASRSASLGRIYSDLGFQNLALVEGWNSVNTDPSNFSAHRLLADSYSALPRHEVARVSELFQSQMLQPLNTTPIQPRLGESNLFLISSGGPGSLSFNEFNPLFNRDGVSFLGTGVVGNDSLWSGEGVLAGIYKKLSFSLGYNQYSTDGWRENAFQKDKIGNAFVQLELSPSTSAQAEYRYRDAQRGDVQTRFFPDEFFPGEKNRDKRNVYRLGVRHNFSPGSIILASYIYVNADVYASNDQGLPFPVLSVDTRREGQTSGNWEAQHLYRSRYVNLTTGAGYSDVNGEIDSTIKTVLPPPYDTIDSVLPRGSTHTNLYEYADIKPAANLTLTLGVSWDHIDADAAEIGKTSQANPKFGIIWKPAPGTTIRGAAFRVFKRTLGTDQTLEPTQVAGFNQFYDDFDATKAWRYGGAVDQQFTETVFGGAEYSMRQLKVPALDQNGDAFKFDWKEYFGRGYFLVTPENWLALRAEFAYERIKRDEGLTDGVLEMKTYRVPLGARFFDRSGLNVFVTGTYVKQHGQFESIQGGIKPGSDDFWLFDAGVNFRLPKRYGFITVGANNLFDKAFNFFEIDYKNPTILPSRSVYARATIAFP
jgi:tetratricopeptide (TPR) repeat protein